MTPRPYTLIAEVTHRCPLACPYCSNPLELAGREQEIDTKAWLRVFEEAEALGVVQLHLTGGEPLARADLEELVKGARRLGLYTNLITSGVPLKRERLDALAEAGLDHVQVSIQARDPALADDIAGYDGHAQKLEVMRWVKELGLPLTMNVVLHRKNLHEVDALVALAEEMKADRLELANTQYLAWAHANRDMLLPTRAQIDEAGSKAKQHAARLKGRLDVLFVKPDYFGSTPKACMDGWARRFILVTPEGDVLPCHAAKSLPGFAWEKVTQRSLADIWTSSDALNRYRGDAWMPEPCKSCEKKTIDYGGCRCQAFALTGDASATDPACELAPSHARVVEAHALLADRKFIHRGRR
jgi:pyrroloquinoline quinone biosynthesis protein E